MNTKMLLSQFYKKNKFRFCVAIFSTILMSSVSLMISWITQQLIDIISGVSGTEGLNALAGDAVLVILLIMLIKFTECHTAPAFIQQATEQYKNFAFEKILQKNISSFQDEATATYISALSNDMSSIEANYLEAQFSLISNISMFIGAFAMMLVYSPLLTAIAIAFSILPVIASVFAGNKLKHAEKRVSDQNEAFTATVKDCLGGFSIIKSFKAEKTILKTFRASNQKLENEKCQKRKISVIIGMVGAIAGVAAQLGVFIVGAYLALSDGTITPGTVILFVNLMNYVIIPIAQIPQDLATKSAALGLINKLAIALNSHVKEKGKLLRPALSQGILIKNVSFSYNSGEEVLHNVCFDFEVGKTYAIVGASGSGKSTLLKLLMASYDNYTGTIFFDANNLRNISCDSIFDFISIVQQNVFIFNASVVENITMFNQFSEDKVNRAIKLAGLSDLIAKKGMDYLCGENGNALSGGERQRISIARSLLRETPILLADEITASLDKETATQIINSILELENLLRIVITHTLDENVLKKFDEILVMKNGRIVENGTFNELMACKQYFYSLYTVSQ